MSILSLRRKQKEKILNRRVGERKKRKEIPNQKSGRKQKEKIPNRRVGESKKKKKIPNQGSKENRRNIQKILWTRQYLNNTKLSPSQQEKKGNHDLKWSSPFDCQPKSCALATFSPRTKQKQKRKGQEHSKPNFPQENKPFPRKSPIDP